MGPIAAYHRIADQPRGQFLGTSQYRLKPVGLRDHLLEGLKRVAPSELLGEGECKVKHRQRFSPDALE